MAKRKKSIRHGDEGESDDSGEGESSGFAGHGMQMGGDGFGIAHGAKGAHGASSSYSDQGASFGLGHRVGGESDGMPAKDKKSSYHGLGTSLKQMTRPSPKGIKVASEKQPAPASPERKTPDHGLVAPGAPAAPAAPGAPKPVDGKKDGWWRDRSDIVKKGWLKRKRAGGAPPTP